MREPEVIEPEVLPPEPEAGAGRARPPPPPRGPRWTPTLVGFLLDALDVLTFGPLGLRGGLVAGSLAAFALLSMLGVPFRFRIPIALGAGVYCAMPGTEFLPLGTLIGVLLRAARPGRRG